MKLNTRKLIQAMKEEGVNIENLQGLLNFDDNVLSAKMSGDKKTILLSAIKGQEVRPTVAGKIARVLNVDVTEIIDY